jgi:Domain of unknown function (DUF6916)
MDWTGRISRRGLLQTGGVAAVGALFGDLAAVASAQTTPGSLRRSRFAPYIGQRVSLTPARGRAVGGRLVAVEDVATKALAGSEHVYVLRFRAARASALAARITTVRHPRFGVVELLMTEGPRNRDGQDYLAVVNRVVPHR